ncbi:MAG: hypothetical protein Q4C95_01245 [Planctomycetia bacterium]|nr:hypothetical protein [Planctomycetia bacterium]
MKDNINPTRRKILNSEQEAKIIVLRKTRPPQVHSRWSFRLLTKRVIELKIVESISYQPIKRLFNQENHKGRSLICCKKQSLPLFLKFKRTTKDKKLNPINPLIVVGLTKTKFGVFNGFE